MPDQDNLMAWAWVCLGVCAVLLLAVGVIVGAVIW